ncbi:MAG: hypothetical protein WB811_02090 [Methanoregula sp.]|uniref:hypothetical protein n=1 Tax=Methanoregula sp. TaxID=2052170 RepID=UPI003BAF512F
MDIEDINKLPPSVIINSILFAAHEEYSTKRKKVVLTKAVKLVVRSIEDLGYRQISYGCFKHGEFSFQAHSITKPIFVTRSLHGANINKSIVNFEIVEMVKPIIVTLKPIMTGTWKKFLKYAHEDRISPEYQALYKWHDAFHDIIGEASECKKVDIGKFYDTFSDIISNLDSTLNHVDEKYLPLYFDYMDLLEGVLMVCRNRDTNFNHVKEILSDFNNMYENEISTFIFPFVLTLKGDNIEYEMGAYESNSQRKIEGLSNNFTALKDKVKRYNLIPTLEDMDYEIEKSLNQMNKDEKIELLNLLKPC